ncbi:MAG: MBL fold metallo-hydrolase [Tannerellaceae bacterium]|nr:MBL fold metallo-hydrolase [Tannerellaceae bacterium]
MKRYSGNMKPVKQILPAMFLFLFVESVPAQEKRYLDPWEEGFMDIHHIATGKGNSSFAILPDGTTLLIDAGDLSDLNEYAQKLMPPLPNSERLPGEWIARYIRTFTAPLKRDTINYALLTHFHDDHIGDVSTKAITMADRPYKLSGISQVAEYIRLNKIVDRGWPDYDYPSRKAIEANNIDFNNYIRFIRYQHDVRKIPVERFRPGSISQFKLLYAPEKYPEFSIRNIYSNAKVWTGGGESFIDLQTGLKLLDNNDVLSENNCSNIIKLSYGPFDYYSGGDLSADVIETVVARLVGPVEVAVVNHHAYSDANHESFVSALRPQVFIIPVWDYYHPQPEVLNRLLDPMLYPQERLVFPTGLVEENKQRLGEPGRCLQPYGHVVVRVYPQGTAFQIYVLNAHSEEYEVIFNTGRMKSK